MTSKRPPIVVVMGHVDHGKTTLLDYIRKTNVAGKEAGGITQSIGAYEIVHNNEKMTFIDTPGHEAFSKMRAHGAQLADLAILVVAADDSVKPQTKDALKHINEAEIPFIVAINKIDKPSANVEKVKQDLGQSEVFLEGYGGTVSWHAISAKTGEGVNELLDLILLATQMENLTYDPEGKTGGIIVSARRDSRKGLMVGVIPENGILKAGDAIATETASGKVRMLEDFMGRKIQLAAPSSPALIIGFEELPQLGERFFAGQEPEVKMYIANMVQKEKKEKAPAKEISEKSIPVILKADESASLEALEDLIAKLVQKEMPFVVVEHSIGMITENDTKLAEIAGAVIVGFRVKMDRAAENASQARKINVLLSSVIYELENDLAAWAKKVIIKDVRVLEILAIFGGAKGKQRIVGGKVTAGPIRTQESFEIWYEKKMIGTGRILNLQSGKKDVSEVQTGEEVGLLVESEEPIKVGHKLLFVL